MAVYCDTNLLVRLYAELPESPVALAAVGKLRRGARARLPVTWLHEIELANALQQLVFLTRQGSGGRMTPERAALALADFEADLAAGDTLVRTPLAAEELVRETRQLSARHTPALGIRAYDVAHVGSALLLGCKEFWSFDARANRLAEREGLKTL